MRLGTGDGIICDKCWASYKGDFVYLSADIFMEQVVDNIVPSLGKGIPTSSFDLCEKCDDEIRKHVVRHYKPTRKLPNGAHPDGIYCEITGTHLAGTYIVGYVVMNKVTVITNRRSYACSKCGAPSDQQQVCKCGGTQFHRKADVHVDKRHYEFIISDEEYTKWRDRSLQLRQNPETSQWSANPS